MNLIQYRNELRRDLKDSGTLWSDLELNRCVQRAVDDLSRFLPLEQVLDITFDYDVDDETFTTPAAASAEAVITAANGLMSGKNNGDTFTLAATARQISPPRRLTVTKTDSDSTITKLTITVKGYDQNGNYVEEDWHLKDIVTSGTAYQGKTYFRRIDSVVLTLFDGGGAGDAISVGTGNAYDSYVFLANKPIRPESEVVTNVAGTTTYVRDTDYAMDYANGGIKFINGGSMAANTAYLVSYDKSKLGINISSILPVISRIQRVQYPAETVPQKFVSFNIMGDFMFIGSQQTGESQTSLSANKHILIYYERKQMPPGDGSSGSYPDALDEVICIGASAYALLMMALKYTHQAITDIAYVDTALDKVTVEADLVDAATLRAFGIWAAGEDDLVTAMTTSLQSGDDLINKVNVGADSAELWRRYAETYYMAARAWEQLRADDLTEASRYIDKGSLWIAEAQNRIANANQYLAIATTLRTEAIERRNEFWSILRDKAEYRKRTSTTPTTQPK
jgi:hypothetical protein